MAQNIDLRRAAILAAQAASIANSQPWHFDLYDGRIDVLVERSRQLPVYDPVGRQLSSSVGCAVFNARVALAAGGHGARVMLAPDPSRPELMARIESSPTAPLEPIGYLHDQIERRAPAGDDFALRVLPPHLRPVIDNAAAAEGARTVWVKSLEQLMLLAQVTKQAATIQETELGGLTDAPFFHELSTYWTPMETAPVGSVLILCSKDDTVPSWLRAGQALQRVLLELTAEGFFGVPQGGPMEVPLKRAAVRRLLDLKDEPVLALLIGTGTPRPPRRRHLVDVLTEH
ncbi:MAG TPA: nitroreductase family protein [Jatrophihabitans sp.]